MIDYGNEIKKGYDLLHLGKINESKKIFNKIYKELILKDYINDLNIRNNLISCCLGLGDIYNKNLNFNEALKIYTLCNNITGGTDFNVLFNLGIINYNLGEEKESLKILKKAEKLEPNNDKLKNFLTQENKIFEKSTHFDYRIEEDVINGGQRLYIFLYSICKFTCCFCDRGTNEYKNNFNGYDTSLDDIKALVDKIDLTTLNNISIGGNEPLTNKNIDEILIYLNNIGIDLYIYSSGSEYEKMQFVNGLNNFKGVYFPIYSTKSEIHDDIVGIKGSFEKLQQMKEFFTKNKKKVFFNKLIIKKNYLDKEYVGLISNISFLLPRSESLYKKNMFNLLLFFEKYKEQINNDLIINLNRNNSIPICFFHNFIKDNNKYILIKRLIENYDFNYEKNIKEKNIDYFLKPNKCVDCFINKKCLGYYKYYFLKFGESEINPIIL